MQYNSVSHTMAQGIRYRDEESRPWYYGRDQHNKQVGALNPAGSASESSPGFTAGDTFLTMI